MLTRLAALTAVTLTAGAAYALAAPHPAHRAVAAAASTCALPAPTTTAGFAALWETVPDALWGGGDVGLSVRLGDGRSVWLYGDSWRPGAADQIYQVHSAALVQDRGCVVAANGGHQLFADDSDGTYYWIHDAHLITGTTATLSVRARGIRATGTGGVWGFADAGFWRTKFFRVAPDGSMVATWTGGRVTGAKPDPGPFLHIADDGFGKPTGTPYIAGEQLANHFGYARHSHPEFPLASGRTLVTVAQNWGDGQWHHDPSWKAQNAPLWIED